MRTVRDFDLKNQKILLRCDFNVPLDEKGNILDDFRIKKTIPTIEYLIEKEAKVILMSHLGRPEGKIRENLRLTPVQLRLMEYLDLSVTKARDCLGQEVEEWIKEMKEGEILLLENLRFHKEEEENEPNFVKKLAQLGDIYINDAFAVCHRNHASVVGLPKYLPSAGGFLLEKEILALNKIIENPSRPMVAIFGGREADFKAIERISQKADFILINRLIQKEIKEKEIQLKYPQKILGPIDEIGWGRDLGPRTINLFKEKIFLAKTIFWSGPLGQIEKKEFSGGTKEIAEAIITSRAFSVVGGGETISFINKLNWGEKFSHLSTGGGAMLAFLSGRKLPGLEALKSPQNSNSPIFF